MSSCLVALYYLCVDIELVDVMAIKYNTKNLTNNSYQSDPPTLNAFLRPLSMGSVHNNSMPWAELTQIIF